MAIFDDFTINYTYKTIYHSNGTSTYTVNEFYSWLMDVFDESGTIDDDIPMTAQTPTTYTLTNGWFINYNNYATHKYLYQGSIQTSGWDGSTYTDGIRLLTFQASGYTSAIASDIGKVVTDGTDTGILLDFDNTHRKWWVRQDASDDNFPSGFITITSGTGAGTLSTAATTGENLFSNPFTLGSIENDTQLYVVQNYATISSWWSLGHIDILLPVQESGDLINNGQVTFLARKYSTLYDHFTADLSNGSRTPIPLATFADTNNKTGYRQMIVTTASADFTLGEVIQDDSDSTIQGIVTSNSGTAPNLTLQYYLFNSNQTDFSGATGAFTGQSSGSTATAVAPSNVGPASSLGITLTFGAASKDLNNDSGSRPYDVVIDCNDNPLADVYEFLKYVTRYGSSTSLNGHDGNEYTAVGDIRLPFDAQSTTFVEGETINGQTSGATGIVVANHDAGSTGAVILRNVSGTFINNENLRYTTTVRAVANIPSGAEAIVPVKQSPFGTFAGGQFFGARGVWLDNIYSGDANNYQLIDSEGVEQIPPLSVTLTVANTLSGDSVSIFRTTGNNEVIDKNMLNIKEAHSIGFSYIRVDAGTVPADTPASGVIRVVRRNASGAILGEERYHYTDYVSGGSDVQFNLSSTLTHAYDTDDTAYVPFLDEEATTTSVSESIVYVTDRYVVTHVRNVGMVPFKVAGQITTSGLSITTIRTTDTIYQ